MKHFSELVPGDYLCDMHWGIKHNADGTIKGFEIIEPVTLDDRIVIEMNNGTEFIQEIVRKTQPDFDYLNKTLVVLQEENSFGQVVCAYSWDGIKLYLMNLFNENLRVK